MGQIGCPTLFSFWGVVMLFEDFVVDLFNNIKSPDGALSCFVYVDGEELLNTTCLFKDVLVNATACADRLSLAIDPIIGQAAREKKSISLMAVVSAGKNDEVYRFKYANGDTFRGKFRNNSFYMGKYYVKEDGSMYSGSFENGQPKMGIWFDKNGQIIQ